MLTRVILVTFAAIVAISCSGGQEKTGVNGPQNANSASLQDKKVKISFALATVKEERWQRDRDAFEASGITDLSPLQSMQLEDLRLTPKNITQGLEVLRGMKSLKTIGLAGPSLGGRQSWPAAEFWTRYDKGEFKK